MAVEVGRQLPAADEIGTLGIMANATVIFDAFDQPAFTLFRERRLSIPLHEISSHLTGAVLAVEDRRFYDHRGFDLIRMAGAAVIDVQAGRLAQGGSTITQQLARVSLLSRERTFRRKIAEIITAVQIERAYPKDRILEFYLNKVYFGEGFYGVEAAAQGYLGKPASDLTLAEAALLVGLIRAPNVYSPADHPDAALTRRDVVLTAMLHTGAANGEDVSQAKQERVRLRNGLPDDETNVTAMTMRTALRLSSNRAAVRLLELTGMDRTLDYAARFALGPQPAVPSVALGSGTVTLEHLTAAYAAFANQGVVPQPAYIRRVERADGTIIFHGTGAPTSSAHRAVEPTTAFLVASLLRDVVDAGTGTRVRREGFVAPAGGKTGTTDDYKDAWFVGFTPELAAGRVDRIRPAAYDHH